ncbi:TadE/TadG family type IV pilus assembly protein, partial [Beijerinckia sp. L45]|uniref:TadE/TadG family type IV pilus assembly protein n=1 Tax=Beijerinckia sp. L45 TaxID=1641855 RepID=UPI001FEDC111
MKNAIAVRIGALLKEGAADKRATVAITVALTLLPLILMIGAGIDYSRAVKERSALQAGTDAAVLQGIIDVRGGKSM